MEGTMQKSATAELLGVAYKTVKSATESLLNLMPKVKSDGLKSDMTVQLSALEAFASRAAKLLAKENSKPEDAGTLSKLTAKWSAVMNTVMDSGTSHLCELLIEEATAGKNELTQRLRAPENRNVSEASLRLVRDICAYEEQRIRELKAYL